ncbi:MAG: pitrilysin family protein [Woeseiaceae bacterium]|nr:pitrilysin family protein [Woeseiaceae bacterium]
MLTRLITIAALLLASATAFTAGVTLPEYKRVELDNGTVLLLIEKRDVPLVGVQALLRGGAVADPDGRNGTASLLASLIQKGAGERDAMQFVEAIASVGGELSARAGLEAITVSAEFMARDADLMIELLADMLMRPTLDEQEFDKLRERNINSILAAKDGNPNVLLAAYGSAFLFSGHPYGNPVSGSESTLAAIEHADLLAWYEEHVGGDRLVIAVSGDFDVAAMQQKLSEAFGGWRAATGELPEIPVAEPETGTRVLLIDKPGATQSYFMMGNVGVAVDFAQRADLDLVNTVFGGRFTSMLNTALRVESGLTYGARSSLLRPSTPGYVAISSFTATGTTVEAIDMALGVLAQLRDGAIDAETVESGRNYILGQVPTSFETASQLAGTFAMLEGYGLPVTHINDYGAALAGVDVESIAPVIDEVYPDAENLVYVILGDAEQIRDKVSKYGPVTELAISEPRFRVGD